MYWDTSALLKLYVAEDDSGYFIGLIAKIDQAIVCSAISAIEILCALYRKERNRELKPGSAIAALQRFRADSVAGRLVIVPFGEDVIAAAAKIVEQAYLSAQPVVLRSLDAIHMGPLVLSGRRSWSSRTNGFAMSPRWRGCGCSPDESLSTKLHTGLHWPIPMSVGEVSCLGLVVLCSGAQSLLPA